MKTEDGAMTDLSEFLLARIADDEAVAQAATPSPWVPVGQGWDDANGRGIIVAPYHELDISDEDAEHVTRWQPARVLAECDAKRRMVGYWTAAPSSMREVMFADLTLRLLALPYADHPDYRDEWRS